jgi:hypothetical protein
VVRANLGLGQGPGMPPEDEPRIFGA